MAHIIRLVYVMPCFFQFGTRQTSCQAMWNSTHSALPYSQTTTLKQLPNAFLFVVMWERVWIGLDETVVNQATTLFDSLVVKQLVSASTRICLYVKPQYCWKIVRWEDKVNFLAKWYKMKYTEKKHNMFTLFRKLDDTHK